MCNLYCATLVDPAILFAATKIRHQEPNTASPVSIKIPRVLVRLVGRGKECYLLYKVYCTMFTKLHYKQTSPQTLPPLKIFLRNPRISSDSRVYVFTFRWREVADPNSRNSHSERRSPACPAAQLLVTRLAGTWSQKNKKHKTKINVPISEAGLFRQQVHFAAIQMYPPPWQNARRTLLKTPTSGSKRNEMNS